MARALASASPLVRTICASAPPSSRVVSASASADAIRARLAPSARAITACASAAAGLTVLDSSSFSLRSASSCASSVCLRTTSCCASAWARGPAWSARACAAATCVFVSASRNDTSRWALIFTCCACASRTAASWSVEAVAGRAVSQLHLRLPSRQPELAENGEQRAADRAAADHDLHAVVPGMRGDLALLVAHLGAAGTRHDQRLVRARDVIAARDKCDEQQQDDNPCDPEKRCGSQEFRHRNVLLRLWKQRLTRPRGCCRRWRRP